MFKPLTVYKASAGSGKTFTLTVEYISLVVEDPDNYRKILAVTFTNKATQEMKTRILSQLYGIAHQLSSSDGYLQQVKVKTGMSEAVIRSNAQTALSLLIHRYNDFRVQTIDAFFQHVLRNLAHELNLTANLRIDLNDTQVENHAVDELIDSLEQGQEVLAWIRDYIDRNIEDNLGWNVIRKIKDFGENIFKDFYKEHERELGKLFKDEKFFRQYTRQLREMRDKAKARLNKTGQDLLRVIRDANVDDSSYFTANLYKWITDQAKGKPTPDDTKNYVLKCMDSAEKWTSGKCPKPEKAIIRNLAATTLQEQLKALEALRLEVWKPYQSAVLTLAHLSQLRLLQAIAETVDEMNRDSNSFMLSNTQTLLKELMRDTDTPFVFEKIGARLKHIMIDEFQDTSTIQWSNFRILLDNCLAQAESHNLIVGDVKQSIYRWRQGDWELLNNIGSAFPEHQIDIQTLTHNYRSEENIIMFNNVFFEEVIKTTTAELEADNIPQKVLFETAYADAVQIPHCTGQQGCVRIDLLPNKDYKQSVLDYLTTAVEELLANGYQQKDIAILVRSKGVIQDIADTFVRRFGNDVSIVSDEAFRLDASLAVNVLIDALHLLTHPDDNCARGRLIINYQQKVLGKTITDSQLLVVASVKEKGNHTKEELQRLRNEAQLHHLNSLLPAEYVSQREYLIQMPVMDLVDKLFSLFQLNRLDGQSAYLCTFYDTLSEYLNDHPADIDDFLKEWSDNLSGKTIQSDEIEGVRLITIHKSKGLEFDNVLIPFCDWELEKTTTIWCETKDKEEPFNAIPVVPVDFSKTSMTGTVYESDYRQEHFQNTVDNMNLLYVAFTRAAKNLFITGKRMSASTLKKRMDNETTVNRSQAIELSLENIAARLSGSIYTADNADEPIHFEYGSLSPVETAGMSKETDGNPFTSPIHTLPIRIETFPHVVSFRQSNKSRDFVKGYEDNLGERNRYIQMGNILHQLFSTIYTEADIESKLNELEQEGIVYNDEITSSELRHRIEVAMQSVQVKDWFSPKWQLFNECTILQYDKETDETVEHRPDRVMTDGNKMIVVDFKFGKPREEYKEQIHRYVSLLICMGYQNVSGYLWYVMQNEIVKVCQ